MGVNVVANAPINNQPNPASVNKPVNPVGRLNSKARPAHPAPAPNQPQQVLQGKPNQGGGQVSGNK
jgi:hypothetical protein